MATTQELDSFIKGAQNRAYKSAFYATRNQDVALDIVQDAMISLVESYGGKPASDLPALFGRIVQNRIHDHFRKDKTRGKINLLYEDFAPSDDESFDFLDTLATEAEVDKDHSPDGKLERAQTMAAIEEGLAELPERQRQAFLLRHWEGLDTEETATAMGVTPGSVKTHLSRATHALAAFLSSKGTRL